MAIQLNDRDKLIFSLLDEHQVLLEKHIAWFIANEQKPVLIRDRLRKLFYLDYLYCQRHPDTLPWWTTPTKPLVYTLSPLTREIIGAQDTPLDLNDSDIQRHLLEIANLRMLFLVAQNDELISNFGWLTCKKNGDEQFDAVVSFERNSIAYTVGILNNPTPDDSIADTIAECASKNGIGMFWIVSRDESHQQKLQQLLSSTSNKISASCVFATHQELYKSGIVKSNWQNSEQRKACIFVDSVQDAKDKNAVLKAATA